MVLFNDANNNKVMKNDFIDALDKLKVHNAKYLLQGISLSMK